MNDSQVQALLVLYLCGRNRNRITQDEEKSCVILFFCYRKAKGTANSSFYSGRKGCDRMGHKDDAHMDEGPDGKGENNDQKFMKG